MGLINVYVENNILSILNVLLFCWFLLTIVKRKHLANISFALDVTDLLHHVDILLINTNISLMSVFRYRLRTFLLN